MVRYTLIYVKDNLYLRAAFFGLNSDHRFSNSSKVYDCFHSIGGKDNIGERDLVGLYHHQTRDHTKDFCLDT